MWRSYQRPNGRHSFWTRIYASCRAVGAQQMHVDVMTDMPDLLSGPYMACMYKQYIHIESHNASVYGRREGGTLTECEHDSGHPIGRTRSGMYTYIEQILYVIIYYKSLSPPQKEADFPHFASLTNCKNENAECAARGVSAAAVRDRNGSGETGAPFHLPCPLPHHFRA